MNPKAETLSNPMNGVAGHQAGSVQVGPGLVYRTKPQTIAIARPPGVMTNPRILVSPTVHFRRSGLITSRPVTSSIIPMAATAPPRIPTNQVRMGST
jgi:hypothetical protein